MSCYWAWSTLVTNVWTFELGLQVLILDVLFSDPTSWNLVILSQIDIALINLLLRLVQIVLWLLDFVGCHIVLVSLKPSDFWSRESSILIHLPSRFAQLHIALTSDKELLVVLRVLILVLGAEHFCVMPRHCMRLIPLVGLHTNALVQILSIDRPTTNESRRFASIVFNECFTLLIEFTVIKLH